MNYARSLGMILFSGLLALTAPGVAYGRDLPDFTALVERQGPAVVNISAVQVHLRPPHPEIDGNDPMFDWFKRFLPRHPQSGPLPDEDNRSLGSGFIISSDGFILTNAHVVESSSDVMVRLKDKREYAARVVGADKRTDVALLKIEATGLPRVTLGNPQELKVGEWVAAIGSPFGFDHTVTAGIVSAKGRALPQENLVPFIQTDVAINPGNSGGPLFNLKGEVVGVNSQIYSRTGGFMGLSFAIPIDLAMEVQDQLRQDGYIQRGRIGVLIQEITRELAEGFGLARPEGALVSGVEPNSPAERGGLLQGDVILKFDGRPVVASGDLPRIVGGTRPGRHVQTQVLRRGQLRDVSLVVAELREERTLRRPMPPPVAPGPANRIGLVLADPSAQQLREGGGSTGIRVEHARGVSARAQLRPGDLILATVVGGRPSPVRSVAHFNQLLAGMGPGQSLTLQVSRAGLATYVALRLEE